MLLCFASPVSTRMAADSAARKLHWLETGKARRGSAVSFSTRELNAFALSRIPRYAPEGVRDARLEIGYGTAKAFANVDFLKLRHASGAETNWLLAKLIQGERPVRVAAHIESANGKAKVTLDSVEVSGLAVNGSALDLLIQTFFEPMFPAAKIGQPFELDYGIDHIDVTPAGVRAVLRR